MKQDSPDCFMDTEMFKNAEAENKRFKIDIGDFV